MNYNYGGKDVILFQYLEERIRRNPSSSFFAMLAYFYLEIDKVAEALSVAQRGVIAHPNYSTGHVVLAMAMERARLFIDAKKELLKAYDLHPGSKIVERLIGELEKSEQADEIGKKLAEQFRKNSGKDIMKTVEETIEANRPKPSTDDFMIPGLDVIIGEELLKASPPPREQDLRQVEPLPIETGFTKTFTERIPPTEEIPSVENNASNIAKAIIDKVTREVETKNLTESEQVRSEQDLESKPPVEPSIRADETMDIPPPAEIKEPGFKPSNRVEKEFDFDALARELESAGPIKPEEDTTHNVGEDSTIELTPEIVTDTLAIIFEQQGQIKAAIEAYNILIKKKPAQADFYNKKIAELTKRIDAQD
ncbi:MAG: hypothetical protein WAO19_15215 [Candidatus Kryptoniota bacterium]